MDRFEHFTLDIFHISRNWSKLAGDEMKRHGLKGASAIYLVLMSNYPEGVTAAKLCELCAKDKADVSRSMAEFIERGLVERCGTSSYRAPMRLTAKGCEIADQINQRAALALAIAGEGISEEKRAVMYECLDRITENLKNLGQEGLPE